MTKGSECFLLGEAASETVPSLVGPIVLDGTGLIIFPERRANAAIRFDIAGAAEMGSSPKERIWFFWDEVCVTHAPASLLVHDLFAGRSPYAATRERSR